MGRPFLVKLKGRAYGCSSCNRPLVLADDWVAECHQGRPFLFINVVNITVGGEERLMAREGIIVKDIFCRWCGQCLGWKYVTALDEKEEYKEGKFMLERCKIMVGVADDISLEVHPSLSDRENEEDDISSELRPSSSDGENEELTDDISLEVHPSSSDGENA
ncbi:hypothetical protein EUGRSUZ_D00602 [Eucalyptus grandis]|uniref:Uncharacterized protein n=2 Tax=Eucalyptus grandis TaxID=71139 RepID=A0ACC3L381_EUCGR|nr:hypothetical protein EUGRSUZ_D00602 [Eucalyptus grandis]